MPIIRINRLVVVRGTIAVYCKFHTRNKYAVWQDTVYGILKHMVHAQFGTQLFDCLRHANQAYRTHNYCTFPQLLWSLSPGLYSPDCRRLNLLESL